MDSKQLTKGQQDGSINGIKPSQKTILTVLRTIQSFFSWPLPLYGTLSSIAGKQTVLRDPLSLCKWCICDWDILGGVPAQWNSYRWLARA